MNTEATAKGLEQIGGLHGDASVALSFLAKLEDPRRTGRS